MAGIGYRPIEPYDGATACEAGFLFEDYGQYAPYERIESCFYSGVPLMQAYLDFREHNLNNIKGQFLRQNLVPGQPVMDSTGANWTVPAIKYDWPDENRLQAGQQFGGGIIVLDSSWNGQGTTVSVYYSAD